MDSSFNLAVHALVYLSQRDCALSSEALAENICTNAARVRRVLSGLKRAGILETHEGQDGGYRLCADPRRLTLAQVAQALETDFVSCAWHSGDPQRECAICSGMAGAMDALYAEMNARCHDYLSTITIEKLKQSLLQKTGGSL